MADKDFVVLDYLGKDRLKMINPDTAAQPTRRAIESVDGYWDWYNEMSEKHIQCPLAQACDLLDADQVHVSGHTLVAILGVEDYEESSKITDAAILFYIAWDSRNISRDDLRKAIARRLN